MDVTVEAETLEDANRELAARTPKGEFVLSKTIDSDGQPATIKVSAATAREAYAKAEALVPKGATIIERREVRADRMRAIEVETAEEVDARQIALRQSTAEATVRSTVLAQPGTRGFFGLGRRVPRWRVSLEEPAVVEVRHRPPARISASTGSRPESWQALATAMRSLTLTDSASAQLLKNAWPYQVSFLLLSGTFDDPTFSLDLPLAPITSVIVDRARQYVERRHLTGMLAVGMMAAGGELRADRFRNVGGGRIGKMTNSITDMVIVQTASCLPRSTINLTDVEGLGSRAFEAIQHYAAIPVVRFCFSLPHIERSVQTAQLEPIAAQIDVYKGTEALLLQIWDELGDGEVITDERVTRKAQAILAASAVSSSAVSTKSGNDRRAAQVKEMFVCRGAYRNNEGLYLVDGQGKVEEELARPGPGEWFGHFTVSPDARWVTYTCHVPRRGDRDAYPIIRAVPAAGGKSNDVTQWDPRYETCYQNPVFSPTGEKIVCEVALEHSGNPDLQVLKLYDWGDRLDGATTGLSIINPMRIGNHAPQFMPDGERIIYFGNFAYEDLLEVCLYDPSVAKHELLGAVGWRLTENADGVWRRPRAIAVQPEWEQIFFIQGHTRNIERICVILLSDLPPGSHRKTFDTVGKEHDRIGALEMSRDALRLAYDGDRRIYLVGTDGSNLRQISPEGMNCECPRFSEDGARLAYVGDGKLCIADLDGRTSVPMAQSELRVDAFVWT